MPQIKNIQTRSQVIKSLLVACLLPLNALNIQAQITIGGNVYGGGNQGEVGTGNAKTEYTFDKTNDTDDMTSVIIRSGEIKNVYGGGRMAGVDGNSSVTIDGTTSTDKIIIGNVYLDKDGVLCMDVTDKCYKCTLYEIPCMFAIPEVNNEDKEINWELTMSKLEEKVKLANENGILFSEFGTRRRFNYEVQDRVCAYLKENAKTCVGTSNVHFAMKYDMKPIGTHPHEWFMFHGAQYGYKAANYIALENWVDIYDGDLGIALSDTYTTDAFFRSFSLKLAKLFDGVRQDSGDEYEFTDKTINFYKSKGIDYHSKTIVFSNALDFPKALKILMYCREKGIKCSFGIGTNLTCDVYASDGTKYDAENIVMKMSRCRMNANQFWYLTIKISDDLGKHMGDNTEFKIASAELYLNI